MIRLRALEARDHPALLAINAANGPAVSRLTPADLDTLLAYAGSHWVAEQVADEPAAGRVVGYLMSYPSDSRYDDEEIRAFRARVAEPFVYICQVALAPEYRRRGMGRALYRAVHREAQRRGCALLCAEVNIRPPNHASLRFHLALGFRPLAELEVSSGFRVLMLTMPTLAADENGAAGHLEVTD
jgi:predicted GNAT superfamily acetyltransferase